MDMKDFLKVTDLDRVLALAARFAAVETESVPLAQAWGRVLAEAVAADVDLPDFPRATMDGYAVRGASTFGCSEANPAYLAVKGTVPMGDAPGFSVGPGEAARIYTGGMLPAGADAVVMIEQTQALDETSIEVYRSAAPGQHMVGAGEDFARGSVPLLPGQRIRPQEAGLLAAFGRDPVRVYRRPVIAVISTGDEIVAVDRAPGPGQIRDINTHTLAGLVREAGGEPLCHGIVGDVFDDLLGACRAVLDRADMLLVSGGSSMGARDFTIEVLSSLPDAEILVHGIPISPGKPTILARSGALPIWGLPGHVVSAMVVFNAVVRPFIDHLSGRRGRAGAWRPGHRGVPRLASCSWTLDTGQVPPDAYDLRVRLKTVENRLLAERTAAVQIGTTAGTTWPVETTPPSFGAGQDVDIHAAFENTGQTPLNPHIVVEIRLPDGTVIERFEETADGLAPGAVFHAHWQWKATVAASGCRFVVYTLYDGKSTPAAAGLFRGLVFYVMKILGDCLYGEQCFASIREALDAVGKDGYVVEVMKGGYPENVVVDKPAALVFGDGTVCLGPCPE